MRAQKIQAFRASLEKPGIGSGSVPVPLGHAPADLCLKGGLRRGVLHEVFAALGHEAAATGFAVGLAMRVSAARHLLWIRQDFSAAEFGELSATGCLALGLDPSQLLLLSVSNAGDALRAANDALSCAALGAVVIEIPGKPKILDLMATRRLTLAATQKAVTTFLLRLGAEPDASTAQTRWLVRGATSRSVRENWGYPVFEASLVRNRRGTTGHWLMEWNCDERIFKSPAAHTGPVVSAPFD